MVLCDIQSFEWESAFIGFYGIRIKKIFVYPEYPAHPVTLNHLVLMETISPKYILW